MRFLGVFIVGFLSSFYLSQLTLSQLKLHLHSSIGLIISTTGIVFVIVNPVTNASLLGTFLISTGLGIILHHLLSQNYVFSEKLEQDFVQKHETLVERALEIFPGALIWLALTSPIWLSFTLPFAVAYLIIIADVYWLFSAFRYTITIFIGYHKMEQAKKVNWLEKVNEDFPDEWTDFYHLIVIPTYKETIAVLGPAFEAVINSKYPKDKVLMAVGFEAWADQNQVQETIEYLEKFNKKIGGIFTTIHELKPGEVKGPGTNRNCIIKNAEKELSSRGIKPKDVLVTTLDADFVIHHQFLAGALHKYLSQPVDTRFKRSFTGVFLFNNNYWQAPTPMRVIASGTSFWQLSEMIISDKYINYSSLSMNMQSLLDVGLWIPNKVNDDSGFYWKAYYHYDGDYKVIPHFLPISADAVLDVTLFKTFQNQYLQLKRWAYGVEHIPFIFRQYFTKKDMNFWDKTDKLTFVLWSYFRWGTLALFITLAGFFIPVFNPSYGESVVAKNLSVVSSWILTAAFVGLFTTIYINEKVAPKRPRDWGILQRVWSYVQWALVPIVLVTITTIPAIDAQTSLMFGRYLEFRVTTKARH